MLKYVLSSRNLLMLTGLGAVLATFVLFAGAVPTLGGSGSAHNLPAADAQPALPIAPETSTATTTSASTTASAATSTSVTTSAATSTPTSAATPATTTPGAASSGTDEHGFLDSFARCAADQKAVAVGNTQRSKVAICAGSDGGYEYRGVRISDGATLTAKAESTGAGVFVVRNEGALYTVSPADLVVTSGGKVIYRDTWIKYETPNLATATATPTTAATPTTIATPTTVVTPSTVTPTTIVTPSTVTSTTVTSTTVVTPTTSAKPR